MTITGRAMYRLNNPFISKSDARSFGPVWYQPIMRSRAARPQRRRDHQKRFIRRTADRPDRQAVLTIDLFEHLEHTLDIVVIEEPRLGILVILLERYSKRVGDVDRLAVILTKQYAHDTFRRAARNAARVMVRNGEQDERMYH